MSQEFDIVVLESVLPASLPSNNFDRIDVINNI